MNISIYVFVLTLMIVSAPESPEIPFLILMDTYSMRIKIAANTPRITYIAMII